MSTKPELHTYSSPAAILPAVARELAPVLDKEKWSIVVPRNTLVRPLTELLLQHRDGQGWLGPRVTTLEALIEHYTRRYKDTEILTALQVRQLVGSIILDLHEQSGGETFKGQVIGKRVSEATLRSVTQVILEMESLALPPEQVRKKLLAKGALGEEEKRRSEIADVYTRYQRRLADHQLKGPYGEAIMASTLSERLDPPVGVKKVAFVGLDGNSPGSTAIRLATHMARHEGITDARIYVTLPEDVESAAWKKHANSYLQEFWLEQDFPVLVGDVDTELSLDLLPEDLETLTRDPFAFREAPAKSQGCVKSLRLPDTHSEVEYVARQVKSHILNEGMKADDIAIIARDMPSRAGEITRTFQDLGIPVVTSREERLSDVPAVRAVLSLFRLPAAGWRSQDLIAVAESPYLNVPLPSTLLSRLAKSGSLPQDLEDWKERVRRFASDALKTVTSSADEEDEDEVSITSAAREAKALEEGFDTLLFRLENIFEDYSPALPSLWVRRFLETLQDWKLESQIYSPNKEVGRPERATLARLDLDALNTLVRALNEWLRGKELAGRQELSLSVEEWYEELKSVADNTLIRESTYHQKAVSLLDPAQAALRKWHTVYVIGLVDEVFPRPTREDALALSNESRIVLNLPDKDELAARERLFFHHSLSTATNRLILTAPASDDRGKALVTSPFMSSMQLRIDGLEIEQITARGIIPKTEADVMKEDDVDLLAANMYREMAASSGGKPLMKDLLSNEIVERWLSKEETRHALPSWLSEQLWHLQRQKKVPGDLDEHPHASHGGFLPEEKVPEKVTLPTARFSPSALNSYEGCPYQFFASKLLHLGGESIGEHSEALSFGSFQHLLLEKLYKKLQQENKLPPQNEADITSALAELEAMAAHSIQEFPVSAHKTLWSQDLEFVLQALKNFVRRDLEAMYEARSDKSSPEIQSAIVRLEQFVGGGSQGVSIKQGDTKFQIHGKIDRVEEVQDSRLPPEVQGELIVKDYKSGSSSSKDLDKKLLKGDSLQLPLYALLAKEHFGKAVFAMGEIRTGAEEITPLALAKYWLERTPDGDVAPTSRDDTPTPVEDAIRAAKNKSAELVREMRKGKMQPTPSYQVCKHCPFSSVCRVSAYSGSKDTSSSRPVTNVAIKEPELAEARKVVTELRDRDVDQKDDQ